MLGALLGGLAGILFPGAGAAAGGAAATGIGALLGRAALPAIGAGLGTLAMGGGGKDAIRNALMFGAGAAFMPGAVQGIRESGLGKGITGGLEQIFGMGGQEAAPPVPSMSSSDARPRPRPAGLGSMLTGQGMTGMEDEARRSTVPSISEIAAARPASFEPPYSLARIDNMVRPEAEITVPYNMVRPEADIDYVPGMTRASDVLENARSRYFSPNMNPSMAPDLATDFLLASRESSRIPAKVLLPKQYRYAKGGAVEGPGTGTSDSIPAEIYQDGKPVQKAKLSDGEFVMTAAAVKGAGNGDRDRGISRMYELMRRFERGEMA